MKNVTHRLLCKLGYIPNSILYFQAMWHNLFLQINIRVWLQFFCLQWTLPFVSVNLKILYMTTQNHLLFRTHKKNNSRSQILFCVSTSDVNVSNYNVTWNCDSSNFRYGFHGIVITGDLNIVKFRDVKTFKTKKTPKYRLLS